jgi:hypothetical protein
MENKIYVIVGVGVHTKNTEPRYLSIDRDCGVCYWSERLSDAKIFKSIPDAINFIKTDSDFTYCIQYSDGWQAPRALSSLAELNNVRKVGSGVIYIDEVIRKTKRIISFEAKRKCSTAEESLNINF